MVTGAEERARHRTPGAKRFVHVDLSWRGTISPSYGFAAMMALSFAVSIAAKARTRMIKGMGR